jgi:exopolyphosphatase/pppGpp-phosphohydrolase
VDSREANEGNLASDARGLYVAVRADLTPGTPVTLLHVGAEKTLVVTGTHAETAAIALLDIGARATAAAFFRHDPPTPGEMEDAIMAVEDAVIPLRSTLPATSTLFTTDPAIREIARIAAAPERPDVSLGIDATERLFERLAALTLGRPASQDAIIPLTPAFAATLLILREFMHHLKFASITVKA